MGPFKLDRGGWIGSFIKQEVVPAEAGVTLATLRIEDPERRPAPRWAVAVPGDQHLRALTDDVAPEADPRAPGELQAQARRFGNRTRQTTSQPRRLQHDEQRLRSPGQCSQTPEPVGDRGRTIRGRKTPTGQVQDEQVHRAPGKQRTTDGQALAKRLRRDDHQPFQADTPGDGLDRIETAREIEPGHDGARGLGLRGQSEDKGGPATRAVAADGHARRTRQAARPQDRVERGEPGPDDPLVRSGLVAGLDLGRLIRKRRDRQRPHHPRSCGTPASPQARDSGVHITTSGQHRTPNTRTSVLVRQGLILVIGYDHHFLA